MIYKLLRDGEWARLRADSRFRGSPLDEADGFIHFSTAAQVRGTAAKHFAGETGLVLAEVDCERLPKAPVWQPARGGALFPHLYAELPLAAVVRTWTLALGPDGRHALPEEFP